MAVSLPLSITFEQDVGATDMVIHVRAGFIRCEVYVPDVTQPVPIDTDDKLLMGVIRGALQSHGAPVWVLNTTHGTYVLWCLAQHVRASLEAHTAVGEAPSVVLAGLTLSRLLPPFPADRPHLRELVVEASP